MVSSSSSSSCLNDRVSPFYVGLSPSVPEQMHRELHDTERPGFHKEVLRAPSLLLKGTQELCKLDLPGPRSGCKNGMTSNGPCTLHNSLSKGKNWLGAVIAAG